MTVRNNNTNSKATIKKRRKSTKKKKKGRIIESRINTNLMLVIAFLTGVLLIISSYAWLSASLNVRVKFFDLSVSTDNGLFISLDGIDFSDSVEISLENVITNLKAKYGNHTNQWAASGLWPVSSMGIKDSNRDKFDMYIGEVSKRYKNRGNRRFLNTKIVDENQPSAANIFISFDLFLKNVSGSPKSDNLFIGNDTEVGFEEDTPDDVRESMANIMNSMRFGFVRINSVSSKSDINSIQNMKCNNECKVIIYEPNSKVHSSASIEKAQEHKITLVDGEYSPTYAVMGEGEMLEHENGQEGTGIPLDIAHFALQNTITSFENPIFEIPNGITKLRTYVWIEGQDIDSLETYSKGAGIYIAINFEKDLAGYE